ncbi:von Willebrand factor type A domain protein [Clostridium formicaceticum]|uniref:von Willebrand factor type A domain protein n=1 Tax=Clostridium formicaceticum TaxID=1497 RepID=A0AAC9WEY3_9CLOT|nr:von Willebrand factor type A domain protein [Clostridium formicaceticum]
MLRLAAVMCLVLSLLPVKISQKAADSSTIFLVDRSLSVLEHEKMIQAYINAQIERKGKRDMYSVISFGKDAMIEIPFTTEKKQATFHTSIDRNFTNLENALKVALTYFPEEYHKRLVLFTDAEENIGNYREISLKLADENIMLLAYPLKKQVKKDIQFTRLHLPNTLYENGDILITAEIDANYQGKGVIDFYGFGGEVISKEIVFEAGSNFYEIHLERGTVYDEKIVGEVTGAGDENPHNNRATAYIHSEKRPRVLVIGEESHRRNVVALTKSLGMAVDGIRAGGGNYTITDLAEYDQLILVNVSHHAIGKNLEEAIEHCVSRLGSGLLVIGGENSFALGEYEESLLEKMLPVDSFIQADQEKANMGLVIAVDASGSMEDGVIEKLALAKESIIEAARILDKEDYLGVIAFSDTVEWIVPYKKSPEDLEVASSVNRISAGGGTLIQPSLKAATEALKISDTKINHIILMTDGEGEKEGYEDLLQTMKEEEITLSTIAIGADADRRFLEKLSDAAGGRNYFAENPTEIPRLLTEETYVSSRKYINEREILPTLKGSNNRFPKDMPSLYGYVSTTLKEGSHLILATDLEEPLLAERNYGLGKTMVWTSDLVGKWSANWIAWREMGEVWREMLNTTLRQQSLHEDKIEVYLEGGNLHLVVAVSDEVENVTLDTIHASNLTSHNTMLQTSKGIFEKKLGLETVGEYLLNIQVNLKNEETRSHKRRIALDYSPEYDIKLQEDRRQQVFKDFTLIDNNTEVFKHPLSMKIRSYREAKGIFLTLAIIFFLADLWLRKNWRRFWT